VCGSVLAAMAVLALASLALLAVAAPRDLNGTVVFSPGLQGVQDYRIPSIVQTGGKQPKLVAFAEARDGGDSSASRIAVRTSTDGAHARTA
jgi:hypothetical protein